MSFLPPHEQLIADFFAAVAPYQSAHRHISFNYLAVRFGHQHQIIRARVFMSTAPPTVELEYFESSHVRAGQHSLKELGCPDIRTLINQLAEGTLNTPNGPLLFMPPPGGHYGAAFTPLHPDGLTTQTRINVLTIMAHQTEAIRQPEIDWEIKAGPRPYDGLQELATEFSLGPLDRRPPYVEFIAFNVVVIDTATSKVSGTSADVEIRAAKGIDRQRVRLGYRVYARETPPTRGVAAADAINWVDDAAFDRGRLNIQIPLAARLNCTVIYDGIAQSHYWLSDPNTMPNPRRAAYEAFDPRLEQLTATIVNAQGRGEEARDLESAVAWLLWMLGFSPAHLNTRRMRESSDLIVATPLGHLAIIECTTGLLKAENKLATLHERTEAVRRSLADSNIAHLHLLPVIVTSKTRAEITPDLEGAEKLAF